MIQISLNGELQREDDNCTLADALVHWQTQGLIGKQYAVAINGEFIPRSLYGQKILHNADLVDVVQPIGGG
ncbi:MAG TPA: sulfur carrier protein ThiS [Cellvibrionaceae bacterium]